MCTFRGKVSGSLVLLSGLGLSLLGCVEAVSARSLRGTYRLAYDYSSHTSCSRSSASTRRNGKLSLVLRRRTALLNFDEEQVHRAGPSRSRYRRGARPPRRGYTRRSRRKVLWKGRVKAASGGAVGLSLTVSKQTCTALPLYGTRGAKPYKCSSVAAVTLLCKPTNLQAFRRPPKGGYAGNVGRNERSRSVSVLRCKPSKWPSILRSSGFKHALILDQKPGLTMYRREGGLSSSWRRRAPFFRR